MLIKDIVDGLKAFKYREKIFLGVIASLAVVVVVQSIALVSLSSSRVHRISIPPDLEFGTVVNTGEIDPFEIYSFAGLIVQQLNYWENGAVDFKKNIDKLSAYMTPRYRVYLLKQLNNLSRLGELDGRERSLQSTELYDKNSVQKQNDGWLVGIDFKQEEHIENQRFKVLKIRHFINVVFRSVNTETNPWGLQLDIPSQAPLRLKDDS